MLINIKLTRAQHKQRYSPSYTHIEMVSLIPSYCHQQEVMAMPSLYSPMQCQSTPNLIITLHYIRQKSRIK